MVTLTVAVTENHIASGTRGLCRKCPIANALLSLGFDNVAVFEEWIELYSKQYGYVSVKIPAQLIDIINLYDKRGRMNPFEFELVLEEVN